MGKTIITLALSLIMITVFSSDVVAQKKKKKKYKKKDIPGLLDKVDNYEEQIKLLEEKQNALEEELEMAEAKNDKLEADIEQLEAQAEKYADAEVDNTELSFKVQLGAYQGFNAGPGFAGSKAVETEVIRGVNKYMVGRFASLEEARQFERSLKRLGISDAWLVPYIGGKRLSDEEAEKILGAPIREN